MEEQTGTSGPSRPRPLPSRNGMVKTPEGEWLFVLNPNQQKRVQKINKFTDLMQSKQHFMNSVLKELKTMFNTFPDSPTPTHKVETIRFKIFFFEEKDGYSG